MTDKIQKQKIYFTGEANPYDILSEILKTNGINENLDDALDKIEKNQPSAVETLYKLSTDLLSEKIEGKNFISLIQKQLNVNAQVAENLGKDIKNKLLSLAEKNIATANFNTKEKKINDDLISQTATNRPSVKKPTKINPAEIETDEIPKRPTQPERPKSGPDRYREPIE